MSEARLLSFGNPSAYFTLRAIRLGHGAGVPGVMSWDSRGLPECEIIALARYHEIVIRQEGLALVVLRRDLPGEGIVDLWATG